MSLFQQWLLEADIPTQDKNGNWYDAETGFHFSDYKTPISRKKASSKTLEARNTAKQFGGKALTGTAKQKAWAEKIRAEKIESMSTEDAIIVCRCIDKFVTSSKFWIEGRNKSSREFVAFINKMNMLLANEKTSIAVDIVTAREQQNRLIASWI